MCVEEEIGIGGDQAFGQIKGLDQEEPPEIAGRKDLVGSIIHGCGWCNVDQDQPADGVRMIKRQPVRDPRAAIMANDGELSETEMAHHRDLIGGHGPFRIVDVVVTARRLITVAIAAQIGGDHREAPCQIGRDPVPGQVGLRMTVQQQQRRPGTPDGRANADAVHVDILPAKAGQQFGMAGNRAHSPAVSTSQGFSER